MSAYAVHEVSFDLPASTVTRANGGFKEGDDEVIGRWVERGTGNTVILLGENKRPLGVITRITGTKVAVALGPIVKGRRAGDTALSNGIAVTGALRTVVSGGSDEPGFVGAQVTTSAATLSLSRGYVTDGGETSTANTEGNDVEVMLY